MTSPPQILASLPTPPQDSAKLSTPFRFLPRDPQHALFLLVLPDPHQPTTFFSREEKREREEVGKEREEE
ncbi:unnamed protein product [Meloidogyne enterolobii]|uniref:Uncharacterized protein n=1 Tax=Meloidogyne enterolobii TaxID=390850 RepID=A0ACB0ZAL7_MELEN